MNKGVKNLWKKWHNMRKTREDQVSDWESDKKWPYSSFKERIVSNLVSDTGNYGTRKDFKPT